MRDANRPIAVGDVVMAKLDDAPEFEAEVVSIEPWGNGVVGYNIRRVGGWLVSRNHARTEGMMDRLTTYENMGRAAGCRNAGR
jgi:hypothetical protein